MYFHEVVLKFPDQQRETSLHISWLIFKLKGYNEQTWYLVGHLLIICKCGLRKISKKIRNLKEMKMRYKHSENVQNYEFLEMFHTETGNLA